MAQPSARHYAFIDAQNVNLSMQGMGWKLDFQRFRVYLRDKYQISRAFLFIGYLKSNEGLSQALRRYGYGLIIQAGGGISWKAPQRQCRCRACAACDDRVPAL